MALLTQTREDDCYVEMIELLLSDPDRLRPSALRLIAELAYERGCFGEAALALQYLISNEGDLSHSAITVDVKVTLK